MNTYVIADIHGNIEQLKTCLQAVEFDYENDRLISLGDICDRGKYTFECVEELLKIKNRVDIRGNHDECFWNNLIKNGSQPLYDAGCKETIESYIKNLNLKDRRNVYNEKYFLIDDMPLTHQKFWAGQLSFYIEHNVLFVHGGFNRHHSIFEQPDNIVFTWDRDLFLEAFAWEQSTKEIKFSYKNNFKEIFIGHTPTTYWNSSIPMKCANIWNLDTGCGKGGKLTIMNLATKQYWQS